MFYVAYPATMIWIAVIGALLLFDGNKIKIAWDPENMCVEGKSCTVTAGKVRDAREV